MRATRTLLVTGVTVAATVVTGAAYGAGSTSAAVTHPATHPQGIDWGPVAKISDKGFDNLSTVSTDNGMVVAAWTGPGFRNVWVSVRRLGHSWSPPTKVISDAAALSLAKDGNGAWLMWQGSASVSALEIGADGSLGAADVIGPSSDPFQADPAISVGANGAVAAAWHADTNSPPTLAYRPAGGQWTQPESVPQSGDITGLVVGAAGQAQLILSQDNPDFDHQKISYLRRSAAGTWGKPFVVANQGSETTVAGNANGDLVIGWQIENADKTFSKVARYKAAGSGFGESHHLGENVPRGRTIALAMADDGSLAAAYQIRTHGTQQIQLTPADSTGLWLDPQNLSLAGPIYAVSMNGAGGFVVTSMLFSGLQVVQCDATDVCGAAETNAATGDRFPSTTLSPQGTITLVWGRGCKSEECRPTRLVAQRGR